jgi:hypothetical protein
MSEEDMAVAERVLGKHPTFECTGLNAVGLAEEEDIRALEEQGLLVEQIPDPQELSIGWLEPSKAPPAPALPAPAPPAPMAAGAPEPDSPLRQLARGASEHFVIQFTAPLTQADRDAVSGLGVQLGGYVPDFAYKAALTRDQKEALEQLPIVRRVVHFDASLTLRRMTPLKQAAEEEPGHGLIAAVPGAPPKPAMYHVRCHDAADIPAVAEALRKDARIQRVEQGRNRIRIWTAAGPEAETLQAELANLPQVSVVEPFEYPHPLCSFVRQALAIDQAGAPAFPWRGEGQVVGVADSGVDLQHPDLQSRVTLIERVPPEAPDDPLGHGTHVCSIIAGDGAASGGAIQGMAPAAKLVMQSIRDQFGDYSGFPVDLAELFQQAYDAGVRVHNDSWGFRGAGLYTTDAFELDQFVFEHPDFLIVVAAGNEGQQPIPLQPGDAVGRIDYNSIASPGSSKNALTVGACCSPRDDGPYQGKFWRDYQGRLPSPQFPLVSDEPICGSVDVLAAFSSRGPTDDTRVKPDLVAPGTVILAARSGPSSPAPHLEETAFGGHYTYQSGTSMAAPVVAGAAALVRQYYVKEQGHAKPSAALLKATLINGTQWIATKTAEDDAVGRPNFHQGFGRLNLRQTLPLPANPEGFSLRFADINRDEPAALNSNIASKSAWKKRIQVKAGLPLRFTLCWTDHPAHGLQNHLNLMVQAPAGQRLTGNPELKREPWAKADRHNNVQRITVDNPAAGVWNVVVNAVNTPFPTQGFSLVATGKDLSDFF